MSVTLIEKISSDPTGFSRLSKKEFDSVVSASVANSDMRALNSLLNHYTGIYDYDERNPWWLESDFTDPIWKLNFGGKTDRGNLSIKWDAVILNDGHNLTSLKHVHLLNSFKYWITATDNPHENGGIINNTATVKEKINTVLALINAILLNGEAVNLPQQHLEGLSEDYLLSILIESARDGTANGIYNFTNMAKTILLKKAQSITDKQAVDFADKHPYVTRTMLNEECPLRLTLEERVKACCWLKTIGYYKNKRSDGVKAQGNASTLAEILYKHKIIPLRLMLPLLKELWIENESIKTEYRAIPNKNDSKGLGNSINKFLGALKLLNVVHGKSNTSQLPIDATLHLSTSRINQHITLKRTGRTRSIKPYFVFSLIEQCYEFTMENQDAILNSVFNVLRESYTKSTQPASNSDYRSPCQKGHDPEIASTERAMWLKEHALGLVDESLIEIGVNIINLKHVNGKDIHQKIRNNESLFALYNILMGSIQTLTGAIMGRRQDELIQLKSLGNLYPNVSPFSKDGETIDYHLIFKVKKTGVGGKHGHNSTIKRPIVRSFARFIWRLEQFNLKIEKHSLNKGKLSLFNNLDPRCMNLSKVSPMSYNDHLDAMCDYFETDLVEYDNGEFRRNYIRQHQLRRFFVMVFFWSKGFDGLESLRWMMGHSDLEHLYHYISESETGAVLNETKASVLVQGIKDKEKELESIDNIDKLETIITKRYGVKQGASVLLSTVSDAIADYKDSDDYKTIPHISQLEAEQELEYQVLELLNEKVITLEPNFFTITDENGEVINTFTLALEVKELD